VILCHQLRTISVLRVRAAEVLAGGSVQHVTDALIRRRVREALGSHLGLDITPGQDGAGPNSQEGSS
jgi:hypothetical protein